MDKCPFYHLKETTCYKAYSTETVEVKYGACDDGIPCSCNGNSSKCNFYSKKRKEVKMNTAKMWLKAQEDGKTYKSINGDMKYNINKGFHSTSYGKWEAEAFNWVDEIFDIEWQLAPENEMTKEEAEKKFGIKIVD